MAENTSKTGAQILVAAKGMGVDRGNGASAYPMANRECGARTMMNGFTEIPAGKAVAAHFHNCEESILVIKGNAVAEINGEERPVKVGEVLFIPPNVPHRIRNAAKKGNLRLFWTYASAFATRTIVETGRTQTIVDEQRAGVSEHEEPPAIFKPTIDDLLPGDVGEANEYALSAMEGELAAAISAKVEEPKTAEKTNNSDSGTEKPAEAAADSTRNAEAVQDSDGSDEDNADTAEAKAD